MLAKNRVHIFYDAKTDYLEICRGKFETISEDAGEGVFVLKTTRGRVVGHGIINACERLNGLDFIDPFTKFAVQVKIARLKRGLTQVQLAKKMGLGLLPYQRLESVSNNPTLNTILKVKDVLPEVSVDKIAS